MPIPTFNYKTLLFILTQYESNNIKFIIGGKIRFKVLSENFTDTTPTGPLNVDTNSIDNDTKICSYVINVSIHCILVIHCS